MRTNIKVSYKLILTFWLTSATPIQSTHNSSVGLGVMQQKVVILGLGRNADFPCPNPYRRTDYFSEISLNFYTCNKIF